MKVQNSTDRIRPECPACGGPLFIGSGGWLTCSSLSCPAPTYAKDLLKAERQRVLEVRSSEHRAKILRERAPLGKEPGE